MNMGNPGNFARLRRNRSSAAVRSLLAETRLDPSDFVYPMFVTGGSGVKLPIGPMPGCYQQSVDEAVKAAATAHSLGIPAVLLFGLPSTKDDVGSSAWDPDEPVQRAVAEIRSAIPELAVITDVCLCEYTSHGHCGVLEKDGSVDNDQTLPLLARIAVSHARSGANVVAPSAMMDGQVAAIRSALDADGFDATAILGYSAKYASAFYGPFRTAADSAPQFGDRRAYQMAPENRSEAMAEIQADIDEGADMVMVKPALAYLDVIAEAKRRFAVPLAAYNVSGEYSMVQAAAANEWIDGTRATLEILTSIKRAGADLIITYSACEAARWLDGRR